MLRALHYALAKAQARARPVILIDGAMLGEELAAAPGSLLIVVVVLMPNGLSSVVTMLRQRTGGQTP